jgi:hypothetical protein
VRVEGPPVLTDAVGFLPVRFAVSVVSAFDVFARGFAFDHRRSADETVFAIAVVTADRVCANGIWTARFRLTFVDVDTDGTFGHESFLTEALTVQTLGVVGTVEVRFAQYVHVDLFARNFRRRSALVALRANAVVPGHGVFADSVSAARSFKGLTLIDVDASFERIAGIVFFTRARVTS